MAIGPTPERSAWAEAELAGKPTSVNRHRETTKQAYRYEKAVYRHWTMYRQFYRGRTNAHHNALGYPVNPAPVAAF